MAKSGAIRAGRAYVELFADDSKLIRGLNAASAKIKAFGAGIQSLGTKMLAAGTAIAAPLAIAVKSFSSMGDAVAKMSKRTGVAVETLSAWGFAAERAGADIAAVETGIKRMQRTINDSVTGNKAAADALAAVGLSARDLQGLAPEEQFRLLAASVNDIEDPTKKAALAMELFGRSGADLIPFFSEMKDGEAAARKFGRTISAMDARNAEAVNDALGDLIGQVKALSFAAGAALAPEIKKVSEAMRESVQRAGEWVEKNKETIITVAKVAGGLLIAGAAFKGISLVIGGVAGTFKLVAAAANIAGAAFANFSKVTAGLSAALTFLAAHPVVLTFTAIAAVIGTAVIATRALTHETAKLSDEYERLRQKGDDLRKSDQQQLQRLGQLAGKEKLTQGQMQEAQGILEDLSGRYGKLGVYLDATTGKLQGVAQAQNKLNAAMKQQALEQVNNEMAETGKNMSELSKEYNSFWTTKARKSEIALKYAEEMKKLQSLQGRKDTIRMNVKGGLTGDYTKTPEATAFKNDAAAQEEQGWIRKLNQLKLEMIADEHERSKALIQERYQFEMQQAEEAGASAATIGAIQQAQALELKKLEMERTAKLVEQAAQQKQIADAARQQALDQLQYDKAVLEIEVRPDLTDVQKEMERLKLDFAKDTAEAVSMGIDPEIVRQLYELKGVAAQMNPDDKTKAGLKSMGTFSGVAAQGLGSGVMDRIAKATEETAKNTRKISEKSTMTFGG
jgi:hypothetical protein